MAVKSLKELKELRASLLVNINLREKGETPDEELVQVVVGMGTTGLAAGARETFNKFIEVLQNKELKLVKVIGSGKLSETEGEPTIQITIPGKEAQLFANVTADKVEELVESVIVKAVL